MARFLLRRLAHSLAILLGITFITYALLYLLPADPVQQIAGRNATPDMLAGIRHQLGLDQPFWLQYLHYVGRLLHGDLGHSYVERTDVSLLLMARLWPSVQLMIWGIVCEIAIGISVGVLSALRRGSSLDRALMMFSFVGVSAPQFIAAMIVLYLFAIRLGWFPIGGYGGASHLVLPALTLGVLGSGWYARMMRSSMIEVLHQDFVRTARAKGLTRWRVVFRHVLPNAVLPVIPMIGMDIGYFMSGLVVVESVFGWPGVGQLTWQAIQQVDTPIIVGMTTLSAVAILLGNLVADLVVPYVDPRINLSHH
ncbi:ABC transporter permease [Paraburkholderia caballeronis]|uniref:Peptide/nickel transport system permease protein n=1 Tax=Paraburkholderia caballeronis TaxID=416943 RepID=A0A1H7RSL1_9BURK|nr:ABC transporter permease [Paraburkholderia caballeronis]PXW23193.1 peptide/nickel transport system permease protein [Paraburkholderia caballeronis]PXW97857.1 peptide/nickel transport system permease protein [Paraburkholderia caballeronis]RAJ94827.1 peptide/nickel transport system permease protein [Paraburkholderia caballeronis]SEE63131.1 peptide/nickel transport system permease protein [Paraburkholderia caballeronis]SEL63290.1 peptide/nickel transport system permease protein [Paraburkholder